MISHAVLSQCPWTSILHLLGLHLLIVKREAVTLPEQVIVRITGTEPCPAPQPGRTRCESILKARSHLHGPLPGVCPRQHPHGMDSGVMYKLLHVHSNVPSELSPH